MVQNHRLPITDYRLLAIQRLYRYLFWIGYLGVLITAFIPIKGSFNKITFGPESFRIRLDHLLHFTAYFLICIYYLAGQKRGFLLFSANSLTKFILLLLFLATVTELIQLWVPERAFNVFDLVSNAGGVIVGVGVVGMAQRRRGIMA
ncbi:MAG: VanZ family protein [Bacteroidales bacterium]|nr:VanZ family protein [Bacteroidales bacterium]